MMMPAPIDLTGRRFGCLLVLGQQGWVKFGRIQSAWLCRCDCGAEETLPLARLPYRDGGNRKDAATCCTQCRQQKDCVICGRGFSGRRNTCSDECRAEKVRKTQRGSKRRLPAERKQEINAHRRERRATDSVFAERLRAHDRERYATRFASSEDREAERARAREWYAANAERVQDQRKARLDGMTNEQRERWILRARLYQRRYRDKWREDMLDNPDRHQRYLDIQREYRRQRALAGLAVVAKALIDKRDETE